ncbi:unnamed protein product [Closterium sp. NIES-64]|nr:unnamed protein product [Closterium sp. NIES-64]
MVLLLISIRCELENLTNLRPASDDFTYYMKLRCSCGECNFCSRVGSISLVEGHGKPFTAEDCENRKFVPLVCLDCRGMEPVEFIPKDGWQAEGAESGTKFEDIDLSDKEFSDYDEKAGESVSILNIESQIKSAATAGAMDPLREGFDWLLHELGGADADEFAAGGGDGAGAGSAAPMDGSIEASLEESGFFPQLLAAAPIGAGQLLLRLPLPLLLNASRCSAPFPRHPLPPRLPLSPEGDLAACLLLLQQQGEGGEPGKGVAEGEGEAAGEGEGAGESWGAQVAPAVLPALLASRTAHLLPMLRNDLPHLPLLHQVRPPPPPPSCSPPCLPLPPKLPSPPPLPKILLPALAQRQQYEHEYANWTATISTTTGSSNSSAVSLPSLQQFLATVAAVRALALPMRLPPLPEGDAEGEEQGGRGKKGGKKGGRRGGKRQKKQKQRRFELTVVPLVNAVARANERSQGNVRWEPAHPCGVPPEGVCLPFSLTIPLSPPHPPPLSPRNPQLTHAGFHLRASEAIPTGAALVLPLNGGLPDPLQAAAAHAGAQGTAADRESEEEDGEGGVHLTSLEEVEEADSHVSPVTLLSNDDAFLSLGIISPCSAFDRVQLYPSYDALRQSVLSAAHVNPDFKPSAFMKLADRVRTALLKEVLWWGRGGNGTHTHTPPMPLSPLSLPSLSSPSLSTLFPSASPPHQLYPSYDALTQSVLSAAHVNPDFKPSAFMKLADRVRAALLKELYPSYDALTQSVLSAAHVNPDFKPSAFMKLADRVRTELLKEVRGVKQQVLSTLVQEKLLAAAVRAESGRGVGGRGGKGERGGGVKGGGKGGGKGVVGKTEEAGKEEEGCGGGVVDQLLFWERRRAMRQRYRQRQRKRAAALLAELEAERAERGEVEGTGKGKKGKKGRKGRKGRGDEEEEEEWGEDEEDAVEGLYVYSGGRMDPELVAYFSAVVLLAATGQISESGFAAPLRLPQSPKGDAVEGLYGYLDGRMDPELVAHLSAVVLLAATGQMPDVISLARVSVSYAWNLDSITTCTYMPLLSDPSHPLYMHVPLDPTNPSASPPSPGNHPVVTALSLALDVTASSLQRPISDLMTAMIALDEVGRRLIETEPICHMAQHSEILSETLDKVSDARLIGTEPICHMAQHSEILSETLDKPICHMAQHSENLSETLDKVRAGLIEMEPICHMAQRPEILSKSSAHLPSFRGSSSEARGRKSCDIVAVSSSEARGSVPFLTSLHWHSPPHPPTLSTSFRIASPFHHCPSQVCKPSFFTEAAAVKPVVVLPFSPPSLPSTPPRAPCSLQLPLFPPSQVCTPAFFAEAAAVKPVVAFRASKRDILAFLSSHLKSSCSVQYPHEAQAAATAATAAAALGSGTGGAGGAGEGGEVGAGRGGERGEWSELAREAMEDLDDEERLEEFVQWIRENGIPDFAAPGSIFQLVYRNSKPSGAKAVADTWLKPRCIQVETQVVGGRRVRRQLTVYAGQARKQAGEHMMTIPRALFLATDKMLQDGLPYQGPVWSTGMAAAWLCREMVKGRESFWWPYLQFLPPSVGLPFFFKPETLMELDSPAFVQKISTHLNNYRSEYNRIAPHLRANTTFFEYLWAVSIINSRAFGDQTRSNTVTVMVEGKEQEVPLASGPLALVPIAELLDHEDMFQAQYDLSIRFLRLRALHALLPFSSQLSSPSPPLLLPLSSPSPPLLLPLSSPSPPLLLSFSTQIGASQFDFIALMPFARGDELFTSSPPPLLPVYSSSPPLSPPIQASQFEFIALMPFTKGAELFTSYGPKVNEELLLGYGFVLDGNKQENVLLFRTLLDAVNLVALVLHRDAARPGEWVAGPGGLGGAAGKGGKAGEVGDVSECHEESEGEEEEKGKKRTCAAKYGDEAVEGGGAAVSAEAGSKGDRELKQGLARIWGEGLGDWLVNEGTDGDADGDADGDDDGYGYGDDYEEDDDEEGEDDDDEAAGSRWGKSKAQGRGKKRKNSNRNKHKNKKKSKGKSKSGSRHGKQKQKKIKKQQQSDSPTAKLLRVRQALWRVAAKAVEAIARERAEAEKQFVHVGAMPQYLARQEIRRESEADEVDGGVEVLTGKYKDPSFGVSVWRGGIVEPNLLAVFAAVWYYLKHQSGEEGMGGGRGMREASNGVCVWLGVAAGGMEGESEADEVNGGVEVLTGKYKDPSFAVSVWRGGIVEPNLMAVFSAVWYYLMHQSEPPADMAKSVLYLGWGGSNSGCRDPHVDSQIMHSPLTLSLLSPLPPSEPPSDMAKSVLYLGWGPPSDMAKSVLYLGWGPPSDMAKSVLYLGWGVSNSGCKDVASPFSNVLPALQAAADTVRLLAQARLQQMPTSIEEDEAILRELERCKSGGKAGEREKEGVKGGKLGREGKKKAAQSKQQHKEKLTSVEEEVSAKRLSRRQRRRAVSEGRISDDYSDDDNSESDNNEEEEGTDADFKSRSEEEEAMDCDAWEREQASGESEEEGSGSENGNIGGGSNGGAKRMTVMGVRCGCEELRAEADERMVAVRFRKAKKAVLKEVVDRLRKACPASPTAFL